MDQQQATVLPFDLVHLEQHQQQQDQFDFLADPRWENIYFHDLHAQQHQFGDWMHYRQQEDALSSAGSSSDGSYYQASIYSASSDQLNPPNVSFRFFSLLLLDAFVSSPLPLPPSTTTIASSHSASTLSYRATSWHTLHTHPLTRHTHSQRRTRLRPLYLQDPQAPTTTPTLLQTGCIPPPR
jgi:hypothetical protein